MHASRRFVPMLVATMLAGCGSGSMPSPPKAVVASVTDLGPLDAPDNVAVRDGGASAKLGDLILWLFGDTIFSPASEDGTNYRTNTAALAPTNTPRQTTEPTDATGAPFQAIPFTAVERAYNDSTGQPDERIALWPGGLLSIDGGVLAFAHKLYVHPGFLNYEHLGVELADFTLGQTTATRSGTLFGPDDPSFDTPMRRDGYVYLYGLIAIDGSRGIGVARAPEGEVRNHSAYQTWNGSAWVTNLQAAARVLDRVPGELAVSWNNHLQQYVAVHSLALSNQVVLRLADKPEGPWGEPIALFTGQAPAQGVDYAGRQHPELEEQNGRILFVSYYHPLPGFLRGELRLVRVEFQR